MKKALRIIVPVLLSLLVLGSIAWYLLEYDSAFTKDLLLHSARYYENKGNHTAAVKIYNLAYLQSEDKQDVAIELADHFKSIGNYTQAECTLSDAIADGSSTQLYMELSKTYVEQDKLLDAAALLDHISDPAIKAELDSLRPAAPVADPEPGFYNQYIKVQFPKQEGTLFVTTDGDYPSLKDAPYSEPVTLPAGETKIRAIAVGDNGLVSPLTIFGYTVVGVIEPVTFQDAAMEALIRQTLQIPAETQVFTDDLWSIRELTVPAEASVYTDLTGLINLETLTIQQGNTENLSFLPALPKLTSLNIVETEVTSDAMEIIGTLTGLEQLTLRSCGISGISPLQKLSSLTVLDLSHNSIRDLNALSGMTALQKLYLQHNAVSSLEQLETLRALETLNISYNSVNSLAPLSDCSQLQWLNISHNRVSNLQTVKNFPQLASFYAAFNSIEDASALVACLNLQKLDLSHNKITDLTGFSALEALAEFDLSYNAVTALPQWARECALAKLNASYNDLENVDALERLHNLTMVNVDYNARITTIDPLADCHKLMQVDAYGTKVTDVSALTAHEIIVNFDPTAAMAENALGEDTEE